MVKMEAVGGRLPPAVLLLLTTAHSVIIRFGAISKIFLLNVDVLRCSLGIFARFYF